MTVFPFQVSEVVHLYNRLAKLRPSAVHEAEQGEPQDVVDISSEARKRQSLDQAQSGIPDQVRRSG